MFGYVPSLRVLNEGGTEGGVSMRYTTLPGPFAPTVEDTFTSKIHELTQQAVSPDYSLTRRASEDESQFASLARRVGVNHPMRGVLSNLCVGRNNISGYAELGDTCE